jgi:hypothetical protein
MVATSIGDQRLPAAAVTSAKTTATVSSTDK